MKPVLFIFLALVGCAVLGIAVNGDGASRSSATAKTAEVKPSPEALGFAAFVIRSQGFFCPEAKLIFPKGLSAQGPFLKVHCGPAGGDGVYSAFAFRLTDRGSKGWIAEEWN